MCVHLFWLSVLVTQRQIGTERDRQRERETDRHRERQMDTEKDRWTQRKTDRHRQRQMDRQAGAATVNGRLHFLT